MKKLFLTLVIAFAGIFTANAQVWLGGSVNAMMNKDVKSFGVAPELGYSFAEVPLTIAVAADFDFYKDNLVKGSTLTLTPYVRYTIATIEKFSVALDAMGEIGVKDVEGYRLGIRPIIAWMATEHWTAAFSVGFLGYDNLYHNKAFCLDFETAAPRFGLYYNF